MCKITAAQVVADGAAVGQSIDNIAAALQTTDAPLAAELTKVGNAIIAATQNFKEGGALAAVEDAEQAAIIVLNTIPLTSPFANLVAIAFAGLNLLIANAQTQGSQTGDAVADAHTLLTHAKTLNADSAWQGKAKINHNVLKSARQNFEDTFNQEAKKVGVKEVKI